MNILLSVVTVDGFENKKTRSQVCPSLAEFDMWNPMWDNHATPVATPYRNEHSHPSCQAVCYNDSPIATDGLWEDSFVRATARVSHVYHWALLNNPSLVFLHDHKRTLGSYRRALPTNVDPSGRNQAREYIQIPTRLRCSQPAMARNSKCPISSLTHSLVTPVPQHGPHNWHESSSTTPVHCTNDTTPQYDGESAWF